MKDQILEIVYNNNIDDILKNVSEERKPMIKSSYMELLKNKYSNIDALYTNLIGSGISHEKSVNSLITTFNSMESIYNWGSISEEEKLRILFKDEAFEQLKKTSGEAFKYASNRTFRENNPGVVLSDLELDENKAAEIEQKLNDLLSKVQSFNLEEARQLVSEGLVDLDYALGSDKMSFRNSH